jgi:DNA repair ATPase RecN
MINVRSEIVKRVQKATVQYAFIRWENAVVIGGTILLYYFLPRPLPGWPGWGWPVLGILAVAALVVSTLTDNQSKAKVQMALYEDRFNPAKLKGARLQQEVTSALSVLRQVETYIAKQPVGRLTDFLSDAADTLTDWVGTLYELALHLDAYQQNPVLAQERKSVSQELNTLKARRKYESTPDIQHMLDEVIESKQTQWYSLNALDKRMQQAERQLDESNTELTTAASQLRLMSLQDVQHGRAATFKKEIDARVQKLRDLVSNLHQIYKQGD